MDKKKFGLGGYASAVFVSVIGNELAVETDVLPEVLESFFNSGYTIEIFLSFSTTFAMRLLNENKDPQYNTLGSSIQRALTATGICSLAEAAQYFTEIGVYDPKDFLAYTAGAGLAAIVNGLSFSSKK